MDVSNVGYGAGGGILSAVLTFLGFKQRLDRADRDIEATNREISALKAAVVFKDTCGVCHSATLRAVDQVDKKLDQVLAKLK